MCVASRKPQFAWWNKEIYGEKDIGTKGKKGIFFSSGKNVATEKKTFALSSRLLKIRTEKKIASLQSGTCTTTRYGTFWNGGKKVEPWKLF